jgi:hypothetical protein
VKALGHPRRTQSDERLGFPRFASIARVYNRWYAERSRRAEQEADPLSVFDCDPDDGPENEGLMHYTR